MNFPVDVGPIVSDLLRVILLALLGINAYFFRNAFQELRELRNDVHGKDGINTRLARVEGALEVKS